VKPATNNSLGAPLFVDPVDQFSAFSDSGEPTPAPTQEPAQDLVLTDEVDAFVEFHDSSFSSAQMYASEPRTVLLVDEVDFFLQFTDEPTDQKSVAPPNVS
jgi:hypothetical protein